jgi:hypothetical protein
MMFSEMYVFSLFFLDFQLAPAGESSGRTRALSPVSMFDSETFRLLLLSADVRNIRRGFRILRAVYP